jgi:hypothetical protein
VDDDACAVHHDAQRPARRERGPGLGAWRVPRRRRDDVGVRLYVSPLSFLFLSPWASTDSCADGAACARHLFAFSNLLHQKRLTWEARHAAQAQLTLDTSDLCRAGKHRGACFITAVLYRFKTLRRHEKWAKEAGRGGAPRKRGWKSWRRSGEGEIVVVVESVKEGESVQDAEVAEKGDGGGKAGIPSFFVDKEWLDDEERRWRGEGQWWSDDK